MSLWIHDSGASNGKIMAGVLVAENYIREQGFEPVTLGTQRNNEDTAIHRHMQAVWNEAEFRAFKVTFDGWERWPEGAALVWEAD